MSDYTSVLVGNVSAEATEETLSGFFGFCGTIESIEFRKDTHEAVIAFGTHEAAETACMLTDTPILDQSITVTPVLLEGPIKESKNDNEVKENNNSEVKNNDEVKEDNNEVKNNDELKEEDNEIKNDNEIKGDNNNEVENNNEVKEDNNDKKNENNSNVSKESGDNEKELKDDEIKEEIKEENSENNEDNEGNEENKEGDTEKDEETSMSNDVLQVNKNNSNIYIIYLFTIIYFYHHKNRQLETLLLTGITSRKT